MLSVICGSSKEVITAFKDFRMRYLIFVRFWHVKGLLNSTVLGNIK